MTLVNLFHTSEKTGMEENRLMKYPHCVPTADQRIQLKNLPLKTWIPFLGEEGYSDGRLLYRTDKDSLFILPFWDMGWAYDRKTKSLVATHVRGLRFTETMDCPGGFYTELHSETLLFSEFFKDQTWSDLTIRDLLELDLEMYQLHCDWTDLKNSYIVHGFEGQPSIITDEEIQALYSNANDTML